jgi:polysaccharide export outer membrane protein
MRIITFLICITVITGFFTGCGINNNMLFKTPIDSDFSLDTLLNVPEEKSVIVPNDELDFKLVTNNGDGLLQAFSSFSGATASGVVNTNFSYRVKDNGYVLLPLLGDVKVQDLSIEQCEDSLRVWYSKHFRDPFVQLRVATKRVVFFSGSGADIKAIPLVKNDTRLMDLLASVGGIPDRGKASRVKLLRKYGNEWKVFMIDLSTIENLKFVDIVLKENDYIYVEPKANILREFLKEASPVASLFSLFTSSIILFTLISGN